MKDEVKSDINTSYLIENTSFDCEDFDYIKVFSQDNWAGIISCEDILVAKINGVFYQKENPTQEDWDYVVQMIQEQSTGFSPHISRG